MRLHPRGVLLALIAVFAMSAVAASAASAANPEFKPVPTKKKFTGTSGTSRWLDGKETGRCSKSTASGQITSATKVGDVIVKFTGCTWEAADGVECALKSVGAGAGEVVTDALTGELGTITGEEEGHNVALLLSAAEKGGNWAVFESVCGGDGIVYGTLAGRFEMRNKSTTGHLVFPYNPLTKVTMDSGTVVKPELKGYGDPLTLETTDTLTFEEALQVT